MLVATMNPCPCGYLGDPTHECTCSTSQILAYQKRLSGPLLDRIDLIINVSKVDTNSLLTISTLHKTQQLSVVNEILKTKSIQEKRYKRSAVYNASLSSSDIKKYLTLSPGAKELLAKASQNLNLTARSYFKVIKVAQTIADLAAAPQIEAAHISEALQYRVTPPT
jgi:magnesium chelatase family protein